MIRKFTKQTAHIPIQQSSNPPQLPITKQESENQIFSKRIHLRQNSHIITKRPKDSPKQKSSTSSFDNPFIKLKINTSIQHKNYKKLVLSRINLGSEYPNPESPLLDLKSTMKSPFHIRKKSKHDLQIKSSRKEAEERHFAKSLIKKQKMTSDNTCCYTQDLGSKTISSSLRKVRISSHSKLQPKARKYFIMPKVMDLFSIQSDQNVSFWSFNPYKTIKERQAKSNDDLYSQELKQLHSATLKS